MVTSSPSALGNWVRHVPGPGLVHVQIVWNQAHSAYVLEAVGKDEIQTFGIFNDQAHAERIATLFTAIQTGTPSTLVNTDTEDGYLWSIDIDGKSTVLWITENAADNDRLWLNLGSKEWTTPCVRFVSDDFARTFVPFVDALVLMHDPMPGVHFLYRWPVGGADFRSAAASLSVVKYDDAAGEYFTLLHLSGGHPTTVAQFRNLPAARAVAEAIDTWWKAPARMILGTEDLSVTHGEHPGIEWISLRNIPQEGEDAVILARLWVSPSSDGKAFGLLCPGSGQPSPLALMQGEEGARLFIAFMNGVAGYKGEGK